MTRKEIEKLADDIKTLERKAKRADEVEAAIDPRFVASVIVRLAKLVLPEGY
jgi:hypothetical protein